ncbi:MAG: Cdc6/Cdc18 family protein [Nitrososphaera sp.]
MDSIITDETIFDDAFIPQRLVAREGQIKEIAKCLSPARSGKSIRNLLISGPPGVGKTSVCRWILNEHFARMSVYVNCFSKRTEHKAWEEILLQAGFIIHGRESTSELEKKFVKSGRKMVICLDEADHLKSTEILKTLARSSGGIILICNNPRSISDIETRIRSGLLFNEVEFKPYSYEEILSILRARVSHGLRPGALGNDLLSLTAKLSHGDARIGLQTIKVAAKDAESNGLERITAEDIKSATKCTRKYNALYLLGKLTEDQRAVYEILKKNKNMNSGRLYSDYRKLVKNPVVDRAYRKRMKKMEELGLVKSQGSGRWKKYALI